MSTEEFAILVFYFFYYFMKARVPETYFNSILIELEHLVHYRMYIYMLK